MNIAHSVRAFTAVLLAFGLAFASVLVAAPAMAVPGDPLYLSVTKTVSNPTPEPGETFVYTIRVSCSEASCLDAQLEDPLPAELEGFQLQQVSYNPSPASVPRTVSWNVDGAVTGTAPSVITADTTLFVDFTGSVAAPTGTGLSNGQTFTVLMTVKVPDQMPVGTVTANNTAYTTATNSDSDDSTATVRVTVAESIAVGLAKTWSPSPQSFSVGASSTVVLKATNKSNIAADTLVVQEPSVAEDGAITLTANNPFTITDFTGFTSHTMPSGADTVQVDAYTFTGGTWSWKTGSAAAAPTLPTGVTASAVGGLRFTYAGAIAPNAVANVSLGLGQRETNRNTDADLSTATHTVDNIASVKLTAPGHEPATGTATATYTVNPAQVLAGASKTISPSRIAAGDSAVATLVGTNNSDVGVNELRLSDLEYFDANVTFGGFSSAPTWPATATSAAVIYHPLSGATVTTVPFLNGETPAAPGFDISGFEIVYNATAGGIAPGTNAQAVFGIDTTEEAVGTATTVRTTNNLEVKVIAPNGLDDSDTNTAPLTLVRPAIDVSLAKRIRPSAAVQPGDRVVTELTATLTTTSDYVIAKQIVVEDALTGDDTFWDAFNLHSIAPTQVPAYTDLSVAVRDASGTWLPLESFSGSPSPYLVELTGDEISALLPTGTALESLTGVRFTFDNTDAHGFASNSVVTPYLVTTARAILRSGEPVATNPGTPVAYTNLAVVEGGGETVPGTPLEDSDQGVGTADVEASDGAGPVGIDKQWNQPTVPAQTSAQRSTDLLWSVAEGFGEVTITDPSDATDVTDTVFDAFDLNSISSIAANSDPFSNGWYLKYDTITAINLLVGGSWQTVSEPTGGWINNGAFVGYEIPTNLRPTVTGVQIELGENTAAREAAKTTAALDPYAPDPGTGVSASSADRVFNLTWILRDATRSSSDWVTDTKMYNTVDAGTVDNAVLLEAVPLDNSSVASAEGNDAIVITNPGPGVLVTKAVNPATVQYVPMEGTSANSYPTVRFALEARSNSVSRASYVRVMDSPVCTDAEAVAQCQSPATAAGAIADPFTSGIEWLTAAGQGNPLDRFDLTGITVSSSIPTEVDLNESVVWLLHYNNGTYSTSRTTAANANGLNATMLTDVVGVSVTYQGTNPTVSGGTITSANRLRVSLDARLRTHIRSSGEAQVVAANERVNVANRVFAQAYDPILSDGVATGARASVNAPLTGGDINVGAAKSVSPAALTEPTRNDDVTVTLGANSGRSPVSSLSPAEVRLTDDTSTSPGFWNQFDFTGLGAITAPSGADQVAVSVFGPFGIAGAYEWVAGNPAAISDAEVPVDAADYASIEGVRYTFSRADGEYFSPAYPAPTWTTQAKFTVQLRDGYRDSGDPVVMAGTVENIVTVVSDRLNGESSVERAASAQVRLSLGTFALTVNKLANNGVRNMNAGEEAPWDLTFTNTGTGFLTVTEVRDALPASLVYLGNDAPVYTPDDDGLLPAPVGVVQEGSDLVFTWPAGDRTMAPGETFSIRINLELQPGLTSGQRATNEFTVSTGQTLSSCGNIESGGTTTGAWQADATTCGTTDYVTPTAGPNLFTVKGVRGAVSGASNPAAPDQVCQQNLSATGGLYFRSPCVANSVVGGTDDWVLRAQNAGTTGVDEFVIFDALAAPDDSFYISGASRGSIFRPELNGAPVVTAPADTTVITEVTTSVQPCVNTWSGLADHEPCAQNGEVWTVADADTDWASVTGLRISLEFADTADGMLAPGQFVDVTFQSVNMPATDANPDGAGTKVPGTDSYAWNQFGVKYLDTGAATHRTIAPARVGVRLAFGAITVNKVLTGPATAYAPDEFLADVSCTIEGVDLDLGDQAVVALNSGNSYSHRIDGIPLGAECVVSEQGDVGQFGETTRVGDDAVLNVDQAVAVDAEDVPAAQVAQITNDYQFSGLSVTKTVAADLAGDVFGPFDYSLMCTTGAGTDVQFAGGGTTQLFSLTDGETYTVPDGIIPVGSTCVVTEVDTASANTVKVTGSNVVDNGDASANVAVGTLPAEVTFTNSYDTTVLTVSKDVDGPGADLVGSTSFHFSVKCEYRGSTLLDQEFALVAGSEQSFGPFPAGTDCGVTETGAKGAASTAWLTAVNGVEQDSGDGTTAQATVLDTASSVDVDFTNTFTAPPVDTDDGVISSSDSLSLTGPAGIAAMALTALALISLGGAFVVSRRRREAL